MLLPYHTAGLIEAGCDEAGRGCLAGPVFAAAVVLPEDFLCEELNDSKKLTEKMRYQLRPFIEENALDWAVGVVSAQEIDEYPEGFFLGNASRLESTKSQTSTPYHRWESFCSIPRGASSLHR